MMEPRMCLPEEPREGGGEGDWVVVVDKIREATCLDPWPTRGVVWRAVEAERVPSGRCTILGPLSWNFLGRRFVHKSQGRCTAGNVHPWISRQTSAPLQVSPCRGLTDHTF